MTRMRGFILVSCMIYGLIWLEAVYCEEIITVYKILGNLGIMTFSIIFTGLSIRDYIMDIKNLRIWKQFCLYLVCSLNVSVVICGVDLLKASVENIVITNNWALWKIGINSTIVFRYMLIIHVILFIVLKIIKGKNRDK